MPPLALIAVGLLILFFLAPRQARPTPRPVSRIRPELDEESGDFLQDAMGYLSRGGQILGVAATGVKLAGKAAGTIGGIFVEASPVATAEITSPIAAAEIAAPTLAAGGLVPTLPTFAIADIGAVTAGFELGAGIAVVEAAPTGAAVAEIGVTAGEAAAGTLSGAFSIIVLPVAIAFTALMINKIISEKEQAKNRSRRAGDANDFLASLLQKTQNVTNTEELHGALHRIAHPDTNITMGSAVHQAALYFHNHELARAIQDHWSPIYGAIAEQLSSLNIGPQNDMTLRDVNSVFEVLLVTGPDTLGTGTVDRNARIRGWQTLMQGLDQLFEQAYPEYATTRDDIDEPYFAHPPAWLRDRALWWHLTIDNGWTEERALQYGGILRQIPYPRTIPGYKWVEGFVHVSEFRGKGDSVSGRDTGQRFMLSAEDFGEDRYVPDPDGQWLLIRQIVSVYNSFRYDGGVTP